MYLFCLCAIHVLTYIIVGQSVQWLRVKIYNMQCFILGALKWQNLILLYIRLVDMQVNVFCLSVLKRATGSKLLIGFVERWLPCLNE